MIHSFLLIGQSNMAGRGLLSEAPPLENQNISMLKNGRWIKYFRPLNNDRDFSGYNLAESFAKDYIDNHPGIEVGLIPCADGGSSLNQWREGGVLFDNAVCQAKLAMRSSTIAGVLWHQGEADCSTELYPLYTEKFKRILAAFRKNLDLEDVPILLGGLGDYLINCKLDANLKNYDQINRQLVNMAESDQYIGYVSAERLLPKDDNLHFNTQSLIEFGHRYYSVFSQLEDKNKIYIEKPNADSVVSNNMELL